MKENGTDFIESKLKSTPIGIILFCLWTGFVLTLYRENGFIFHLDIQIMVI